MEDFIDGVPHSFQFTQTGEEHVCMVRVTMPDNSVRSFETTCATKHAARLIARYKASSAIREMREAAGPASQGQEAPGLDEQEGEVSRDSSPKSLDVESHDSEPLIESPSMIVDTPLDEYSSNAEDDDDDELRVSRRQNRFHAPIAFVPAPDTSAKKKVDNKGDDVLQKLDEKSSVGRSSLGEAKSQHIDEVLDAAPLQERFRESSDVEEEGEIEPFSKSYNTGVGPPRFTPQKRNSPSARPEHSSVPQDRAQHGEFQSFSQRRTKPFRSKDVSRPKSQDPRKRTQRKRGSLRTTANKRSNLPSSTENGNKIQEEPAGATESRTYQHDRQQPQPERRELHNAELPLTTGSYDNGRIPRAPTEPKALEAELDMTQPIEHEYSSTYQHHPPPPGPMSHPPHPAHIHNAPPAFAGHHMFPGAAPHMSYASQYPPPHMPHHPPHMSAPYPPLGTYAATQTYMQESGFPPTMMAQPIGGYPYQQPVPNGTAAFYHTHAQPPYSGPQLQDNQKAQQEAEIRAVAAELAAEAAAKDAARNAKSDFEADQKAKRACHGNGGTPQESGKKGRKGRDSSPPDLNKKSEKESASGSAKGEPETVKKDKAIGNEVTVSSIPADDGDQEDYISTLNKMAQKGQNCTNLSSPTFVTVRVENGSAYGQQCTMSVRFVPDPEKEGIILSKTVVAGRKKKSKQLAAKELLAEIDRRLEELAQSSEEEVGSKEKVAKTTLQKKNADITTAVTALHRLYTLNTLCGPPIFKPEEPSEDANRGAWKSVVILDVKDFGKHHYEEFGSSKKVAKQKCAFKALEALKEMKVPGVESFTNISKDGKDPEKNKAPEKEDTAPIDAIVEMSEDEKASNSSLDAELVEPDDRLLLPKDYKLEFPQNEFDCEQWIKENSESDAHFGLFVDSPSARTVFTTTPAKKLPERTTVADPLEPRFLCLSTATSGIVVCFPQLRPETDSDSTGESNASLPEAVVGILEDPKAKKHGFAVEDGMSVLEDEEDFRAEAVDDIAMISLAITGPETVRRSGPLPSLLDLTRHWLRKEPGKISVKGSWRDKSDIPIKLSDDGGKEIITGVLASYGCFCISQQMTQAARQKRTRAHGVAVAFLQLSEQVMSAAPA